MFWGTFLSIVPGGLVIAMSAASHTEAVKTMDHGAQVALVMLAALIAGPALGAIRRVFIDQALSVPDGPNVYDYLTAENLLLFRSGVEHVYCYYKCYAHLAMAFAPVCVRALIDATYGDAAMSAAVVVLLSIAAHRQHRVWLAFAKGFVECERRVRSQSVTP